MWGVPQLAIDTRRIEELESHELVPEDVLALDAWGYVVVRENARDVARRSMYVLANAPSLGPGEVVEVAIRIQGFVEECNLGPLGDWNM